MQSWDLNRKIQVSQTRLIEWYKNWDGKCYVSFSGGKDSTVLAYLTAQVCTMLDYKLILWFSDTGLEYPDVREHVKKFPRYLKSKFPNLDVELIIGHPTYGRVDEVTGKHKGDRITFRDVIKKYGYPLISKEISHSVHLAKHKPDGKAMEKFVNGSDYHKKYGDSWMYTRWKFLIDAPFEVSARCCTYMKKNPAEKYDRESGNKPILGTMAYESKMRKRVWYEQGCNGFDMKHPSSKPLSFWLEQDILKFIYEYNIPIATIYGDVVLTENGDFETTGESRTGCMFCGFGCQLEKEPNRFQRLKQYYPKLWEYCMKPYDEGGLGMKEVLDYINVKTGEED